MRAAREIATLLVALGLSGGLALAQSSLSAQRAHPAPSAQPAQPAQPAPLAESAPFTQPAPFAESAQPLQTTQPAQAAQTLPPSVRTHPSQLSQAPPPRYSADGLYNLANAYARAGKAGLAVLNYERAALLAPDDPDIRANLEYVRASAHLPAQPRNRLARIAQSASPTLLAWIGVLGLALVGSGLLARRRARQFRWMTATSTFVGIALMSVAVLDAVLLWPRMHEAVVLVNQTPARVSPVPMGEASFVLPEAETVTVAAEHEDFILIRTRSGLSGWVARGDLGTVVP